MLIILQHLNSREQRWVLLKDSSIYVYRWVPVSGSTTSKPTTVQKTVALLSERANSNENSNDTLNSNGPFNHLQFLVLDTPSNSQLDLNEEESNTAFYEGFESDSNQASNMVSDLSRHASGGNGSTDFSSLIKEEKDAKEKE